MKNLKNKAIITLLLVCMLVSVLLTGCSNKELTPEEIRENLVIQYYSGVDYYPEDYAVMYDSFREGFDEKLETIPAEGSYSFDGKEYILTHDTEKRLKIYEKGYFTFYHGKAEDGQTLEIEIAEVCDYPTRLILSCDCNEHFEYANEHKVDYLDNSKPEMYNCYEAELQKMLDKVNAGIDLSEYEGGNLYYYLDLHQGMNSVTVQWIDVFYCKSCKKMVGYQIDGVVRLEEVLDNVPYVTKHAFETAVKPIVDAYNENVYHLYDEETTEETTEGKATVTTKYVQKSSVVNNPRYRNCIRYYAEFDRYYIAYDSRWESETRRKVGTSTHVYSDTEFWIYTAYLLEPKSNTGVIIAVAVVSVIILASILFFFAKKKKGKISETNEAIEEAQQE